MPPRKSAKRKTEAEAEEEEKPKKRVTKKAAAAAAAESEEDDAPKKATKRVKTEETKKRVTKKTAKAKAAAAAAESDESGDDESDEEVEEKKPKKKAAAKKTKKKAADDDDDDDAEEEEKPKKKKAAPRKKKAAAAAAAEDEDTAEEDADADADGDAEMDEKSAKPKKNSTAIIKEKRKPKKKPGKGVVIDFDTDNDPKLDKANLLAVLEREPDLFDISASAHGAVSTTGAKKLTPNQIRQAAYRAQRAQAEAAAAAVAAGAAAEDLADDEFVPLTLALKKKLSQPRWIVYETLTLHATPNIPVAQPGQWQPTTHQHSAMCSTQTSLCTWTNSFNYHQAQQEANRRKIDYNLLYAEWQAEHPDFASLTGETLVKKLVPHPGWKGLLRVHASPSIEAEIVSILSGTNDWWSTDLTRIVLEYFDIAHLSEIRVYTVELNVHQLELAVREKTYAKTWDDERRAQLWVGFKMFQPTFNHYYRYGNQNAAAVDGAPDPVNLDLQTTLAKYTTEPKPPLISGEFGEHEQEELQETIQKKLNTKLYPYQLHTVAWAIALEDETDLRVKKQAEGDDGAADGELLMSLRDMKWRTLEAAELKWRSEQLRKDEESASAAASSSSSAAASSSSSAAAAAGKKNGGGKGVAAMEKDDDSSSSSAAASAPLPPLSRTFSTPGKVIDPLSAFSCLLFDYRTSTIRLADDPRLYRRPITSIGGVIADQMGLGKTLTAMGLIFGNPRNPLLKRPALACRNTYESNATLVVCPSHLCQQWKSEIEEKHGKDNIKVLNITTIVQHRKATYLDFMTADVVIVSIQYFGNVNHKSSMRGDLLKMLNTKADKNPAAPDHERVCGLVTPNFNHFTWHRMILDEGHEIVGQLHGTGLKAHHQWLLTGTPFANPTILTNALAFLDVRLNGTPVSQDLYTPSVGPQIERYVYNHIFVRNTKQSIGTMYKVPDYVTSLAWINLSPVERLLYDFSCEPDPTRWHQSGDREKMLYCCHPQDGANWLGRRYYGAGLSDDSAGMTLTEVVEKTTPHLEQSLRQIRAQLAEEKKRVVACDGEIKRIDGEIAAGRGAQMINLYGGAHNYFWYNGTMDGAKTYLADQKVQIAERHNSYVEHEKQATNRLARWERLIAAKSQNLFSKNPLFCSPVAFPGTAKQAATGPTYEQINYLGSKIAHVLYKLQTILKDKTNRIILFSQFNSTLDRLQAVMRGNDIKYTTIAKGNVHVRSKALRVFYSQEEVRILMLSLESSASGTNLTEASHVLLLDPFSGTKEEQEAAEAQAIGRAHRQGQQKKLIVVRFLAKNSVEAECYNRTISDAPSDFTSPRWKRAKKSFQKIAKAVAAFAKKGMLPAGLQPAGAASSSSSAAAAAMPATGLDM